MNYLNLKFLSVRRAVLIAANPEDRETLVSLREHGLDVLGPLPLDTALDDHLADCAVLVVDGRDADTDTLGTALDAIEAHDASLTIPVLVLVDAHHIDLAAASSVDPTILCEESSDDWAIALEALRLPPQTLHDSGRDGEKARLEQMRAEVAVLAETLAEITRPRDPAASSKAAVSAREIRAVIKARRLREEFFPKAMLGDPAWDILLDLLAASLEQRRTSVSSACIASAVPATTGLRWVGLLEESGLVQRDRDPADRRRAFVRLSHAGKRAMIQYANAAKRLGLSLA